VVRSNAAFAQLLRARWRAVGREIRSAWPLPDRYERARSRRAQGAIEVALDSRGDVKPVDVVFEDAASQGETDGSPPATP